MAPPEGMRIRNEHEYPEWTKDIMRRLRKHNLNTYRHSVRVGFIAYSLWKDLIDTTHDIRLKPHINNILIAGFVHDSGKLRVPTKLLDRAGNLNENEKALIARHPHTGAAMVYRHDPDIADIIRGHHKWGSKLAYITYPRYDSDPDARSEGYRQHYPVLRLAQIVLAVADKADVAVNRINGLGGGAGTEVSGLSERFEEEIKAGYITEEMLSNALLYAVKAGEYQRNYWKGF